MTAPDLAKRLLKKPITPERVQKLKGACRRFKLNFYDVGKTLALEDWQKVLEAQKQPPHA